MKNDTLLDALQSDYLVQLFRETLKAAPSLSEDEQNRLDETLWGFVTHNHKPLATLAENRMFLSSFPEQARTLFQRAIAVAPTPEVRAILERRAQKEGLWTEDQPSAAPRRKFGPMTRSQAAAFRRLRALVELHFRGRGDTGVNCRTNALLVGPTGVGKSTLVERLADFLGIEFVRLTVSDWIVAGARSDTPTLKTLLRRVRAGGRMLLAIDELDKLRGYDSSWTQSIQVDLLNLLDRSVGNGEWSPADRENLRRNVAVVGCGTWDAIWRQQTVRSVGFGADCGGGAPFDVIGKIRRDGIIPRELLNRFAEPWLLLEPLDAEDFRRIAQELKLEPGILDPEKAAASGLGYRAVENALTEVALDQILRAHDAEAHLSFSEKPTRA